MFFADPVAAFTTIAGALTRTGRLVIAVPALADSDIGLVFAAAASHLPGFDVGHGFGAFADPAATADLLGSAGFTAVANELVETESVWGTDIDDAADFVMGWGPTRYHRQRNDFATDDELRTAISAALVPFAGPGAIRMRAASRLITATVALR